MTSRSSSGYHLPRDITGPVSQGMRNDTLFRIGCALRAQGLGGADLETALHDENRRLCVPPLHEREVLGIARSAERYEPGERRGTWSPDKRPIAPSSTLDSTPAPPPEMWQTRASEFLAYSQEQLGLSPVALDYLTGRGLTEETIQVAGLGYNPGDLRDSPERWGLSSMPVWLPQGWVIPNESAGVLWGLTIRRSEGCDPKYGGPRGGRRKLFGLDRLGSHGDLIIVEGEFDALLLWQEVGLIANVIAHGGTGNIGQLAATPELLRYGRWWSATDYDCDGERADEEIRMLSLRVRRLPPAKEGCKDPTEMWRSGASLVEWAVTALGPEDPRLWLLWAKRHLNALDDCTFKVTDLEDTRLRLWLALETRYTKACRAMAQADSE